MSDEGDFELIIDRRVTKRLRKLPPKHFRQVTEKLKELSNNPFPQDYIHLKGKLPGYRVNIGEYRILYMVDTKYKTVDVYLVLNRNEGYPTSV